MKTDKKFSVTRFCALIIASWIFAVSTIQMYVLAQELDAPMPPQTAPSSPFAQRQELMAADGVASDQFGSATAISGDLAVIGSPTAKVGGMASVGAAYVFNRSENVWSQQQKPRADQGTASDQCGFIVATDGRNFWISTPFFDLPNQANRGVALLALHPVQSGDVRLRN